jgi:hypothetical protein
MVKRHALSFVVIPISIAIQSQIAYSQTAMTKPQIDQPSALTAENGKNSANKARNPIEKDDSYLVSEVLTRTLGLNTQSETSVDKIPNGLLLGPKGKLKFSKQDWTHERDQDGTEVLSIRTPSPGQTRVAATRSIEGDLEAITFFKITNKKPSAPLNGPSASKMDQSKVNSRDKVVADQEKNNQRDGETAGSFFFETDKNNLRLLAFTSCQDNGESNSVGRVCVTATPLLCSGLASGKGIPPTALKDIDQYETKALSLLLTLRGSDHQLDNLLRTGNRLGLKSGLQTTKGQLIALAQQIEKEKGQHKNLKNDNTKMGKTVAAQAKQKNALEVSNTQLTNEQETLIRRTLEESLPRLKQACIETELYKRDFNSDNKTSTQSQVSR